MIPPCVEYDCETTGLQWYAGHRPFMYQFLGGTKVPLPKHVEVLTAEPEHEDRIQRWFSELPEGMGIRAHNAKFDLHMAEAQGFKLPPDSQWHCSMIASQLVDERQSAALKRRHDAVFNVGGSDLQAEVGKAVVQLNREERKRAKEEGREMDWATYLTVFQDERFSQTMIEYGVQDCILQRELMAHNQRILENDPQLVKLYDFERENMVAAYRMESRGVPIDRDALAKMEGAVLEEFDRLDEKCKALAGIKTFNPGAPTQIEEALTRRGADLSLLDNNKTGHSFDADNLVGVHDELADAIIEWRGVDKLLSTYLTPALHRTFKKGGQLQGWQEPFLTGEDRIHPSFNTNGARTGRWSCSMPNVQNIPRDDLRLRYTWKAGEGKLLVVCDMDQIEARLLAAAAGDGRLRTAFRNGEDIHTLTAKMMGLTEHRRAGGHVESARQRGKLFKYMVMYGAGIG
jgi:DNA polymerase I-like protein with 3'-5' exonuclease and polymerase domains